MLENVVRHVCQWHLHSASGDPEPTVLIFNAMQENYSQFIIEVIIGTPLWVWPILCYLLYVGFKATRDRVISPYKLMIMPLVFIIVNYKIMFIKSNLMTHIGFLLIGCGLGFILAKNIPIQILKARKKIGVSGEYYSLIILLAFFITKYIFGYLQAVHPLVAAEYSFIQISVCALLSGFFLGKFFCFLRRYYSV